MMGHARSRFSAHLPAKAAVHFRKSPCNSFVRKTLPLTPTHSIVCPAKSLSPRKHGICRMGGGGVTIPSFPIREKKLEHQIPRPPCGGLVMTNLYQEPLRAPTCAAAAHAAIAAAVANHDGSAGLATRRISHVHVFTHRIGRMLEHSTIFHPQFCMRFGYGAYILDDAALRR